ncbi:MAG: arginine--tRNA ligase [Deltaproteobacteria bacterium]|nr:arginine--tRNA ligase [Deltaproteobacteria bacterium]
MRVRVHEIVRIAVESAMAEGALTLISLPEIIIEKPKKDGFGDFATNAAMLLSGALKKPPREIASVISAKIAKNPLVEKCEVAGPGFINIFLKSSYWTKVLSEIIKEGAGFGRSNAGGGKKVLLEFVSANPTGPLHIGHGRGAAVGDSLARIMGFAGFKVTREFYINDIGAQTIILGESVKLRFEELIGKIISFPDNYYKGEYVKELAKEFRDENGKGANDIAPSSFQNFAGKKMLGRIKKDLKDFGVEFDNWYSEGELVRHEGLGKILTAIEKTGFTFVEDGALWMKTKELANDDKDRVLQKANGETTYFLSDVAYHKDKVKRGFDILINVWGADHHGYEARIRAALKAFGHDPDMLKIIFIQLVALMRSGAPVPMGKREGEFVTLRQVMDEVGVDACRFFFLMRKSDAQLDFDLELAKKQAPENPVYYVQYCHARIKSIIEFAKESGINIPEDPDENVFGRLKEKEEFELIRHLSAFEEVVAKSARDMEPHKVTFYLTELAGMFHPYYNKNRVVTSEKNLTLARLLLCKAVATVAANGLTLLGVNAPDKM